MRDHVARVIDTEARYQERASEREEAKAQVRAGKPLEANDAQRIQKRAHRLQTSPEMLERIINGNELLPVSFFTRGRRAANSVARIRKRSGEMGSGFLVSSKLILTNQHVLRDADDARGCIAEFGYEVADDGSQPTAVVFELTPDEFFLNDEGLDYALVAVAQESDSHSLSEFGYLKLIAEEGKALVGEFVNLIQHPEGNRKQISIRENRITDITDSYLVYESDTLQGSSGSPVFNDQWEVIGLHHSGVCRKNDAGDCLTRDGRVWTREMGDDMVDWIANEGIRASVLVAHIKGREVQADFQPYIDEI